MNLEGPVTLVFLVGLAAGSWWLANRGSTERPADQPTDSVQPGYYLSGAELDQTDEAGRLMLRVRAERATQSGEHGPVRLEKIEARYLPEPGQDWLLSSASGSLPPDGRVLLLAGDVSLRAAAAAAATGAVVRTEHLKLDVDSHLATTSDRVRIEFGRNTVGARGLRADLKHETLTLESAVNGTFTR